ncbi:ferritin family protein [Candidatus Poribacteria bacterium]|nr:ferritin family protein [Candidatus Poribacteria bacterium]
MTELPEKMEDIVKFAIQLEEDGLRMYREFAEKSKDPFGKKTFEGLVEDEQRHAELLRRIYAKCGIEEVERIVAQSRREPVRQRFKTIFELAGEEARRRASADPSDIEAMRIALDFEKRGYNLYNEAQQKAKGQLEKTAFKHLTMMEGQHFELLQETFEYLNDTANWFMKNEGWMFEGGAI